jgi:hypothetical protein
MSVTITDDIVRATHLTEAEFVEEIAVYTLRARAIDARAGKPLGEDPSVEIPAPSCQPGRAYPLRRGGFRG